MFAQILYSKGIKDKKNASLYLNPSIENIPDPVLLPNVDKAVDIILSAIKDKKIIYIY